MTDRDLIGEKVVSKFYGEGEIIDVFENKVEIQFSNKKSQFHWEAFSKSIMAARPEVQKYIVSKNYVTVSYNYGNYLAGGVNAVNSISVLKAQKIILPDAPSGREGYHFIGWSDGVNTFHPGDSYVVREDTTFQGLWRGENQFRRIYFVFQGKTWQRELQEGFIFAPYSKDRYIHHWERMDEVRSGDVILHGVNGQIVAISEAQTASYRISMPKWAGEWVHYGPYARRVDIKGIYPLYGLTTRDYTDMIIECCRRVDYPPFNRNGGGNQGYLFSCPTRLASFFIRILLQKNPRLKNVAFIDELMQQLEKNNV